MIAISFLGPTQYKETTYVCGTQAFGTRFFAECLPHFYPDITEVMLFVTPTVRQHANCAELSQRMGEQLRPITIPEGHSEQDLWEIFDKLTSTIPEGSEVLFDITNSFRSLPFVIFLAAAYLRSARHVKVVGILYGAFEAKDVENRSPVFDLSPFITLLDWLNATDQFVHTGDARRLAALLNPGNQSAGTAAAASRALSEVSLAAFLCQPFHLMAQVGGLEQKMKAAEVELEQLARPFGLLQEEIERTFGAFKADFARNATEGLQAQLRLIEWYYGNNQLIQAVTLAREWVITAVTNRLGLPIDLGAAARRQMERAVSGLGKIGHRVTDEVTGERYTFTIEDLNEYGRRIYENWPERELLVKLWNELAAIRNALDHAGHQTGAMALDKIVNKTRSEVMPRLREMAQLWGLSAQESTQ